MSEVAMQENKYQVNGQPVSRAAFIRDLFLEKNLSRGDIRKTLCDVEGKDVPYYIVYSATQNLHNAAHPAGAEGAVSSRRGVILEDGTPRAEKMREMARQGVSRGEIAKHFDTPYATVFAATKDIYPKGEGGEGAVRQRVVIKTPDGREVGRAEYIRELFAQGATRRQIANQLQCDYAIVWAATKGKKDNAGASAEDAAEDAGLGTIDDAELTAGDDDETEDLEDGE